MILRINNIIRTIIVKYIYQRDRMFGKQIIRLSSHMSPHFLIIGVTKGGTTSLFQYLTQHPDILPPLKKEVAYFSWNDKIGMKKYLKYFPFKKGNAGHITFEATPSYFFYKNTPAKVAKFFPNIKLIAILRDPVKRAFSHWQFYHHSKFVDEKEFLRDYRSFEIAIEEELSRLTNIPWHSRYIDIGKYAIHLKKWYDYFPKEQILLLDADKFKNQPKVTLKIITDFLDITPYYQDFDKTDKKSEGLLEIPDKNMNKKLIEYNVTSYDSQMKKTTENLLRKFYIPYDEELFKISTIKFSWMDRLTQDI